MEIRKPFAKILKDIRKKLGKSQKTQEKTQNSRKKLKTQGKNSMSRRIAPLLTSQVMLKKKPELAAIPGKLIGQLTYCPG